ncbi:3-dehydroquinate synthase [Candidatus Venteria ishoeyi]|uniref:3-dehydroquinate synthase n=1 Tax=Candidatus Venteria ishoeyi TaxID=1899563 RepID=UPI0025A61663|nr:3-dehydroquinate synthase [Candidatus Venteria ishoeyi]MDM8547289.1 3-dehydroquinate synthase [Candidatus Venteria ishoeyi]
MKLNVDLGKRSYPIFIGRDLLGKAEYLAPYIRSSRVMVVSNETVAPLYLEKTLAGLTDFQVETVILPDGEQYKNLEVLNQVFDGLLRTHCDRRTTLIALGGGVVGDMTGFAAACYQRGVPFIQIPTTLLAQVDSSVGGKTGVNHALGKNMIGAFHQPQVVLCDTDTLNTLEDRQLSAGLAEVVKYGLIRDLAFFDWLEQNVDALLSRDPDALAYAIERSCQNKADVVAEDELEGGVRALLNLGHTFGHSIETGLGYGQCLHGEAVAIGMYLAADLSQRLGWISASVVHRIETLLEKLHLPVRIPEGLDSQTMLDLMKVDKKVLDGQVRLVLQKSIAQAVLTTDYDADLLHKTLATERRPLF